MDGFTPDFSARLPMVVLLEDDNAVRRSLQLLLQGHGFDVKAYASPETLLADPQGLKADCILSDYRLAGSDGITVLEMLRTRGWMAPAVMMTAYGSDDLTAQAKSAGFVEVIAKPFQSHALVAVLACVLAIAPRTRNWHQDVVSFPLWPKKAEQ